MAADFKQLVEALNTACHRLLKTDNPVTRRALTRALAAYRVPAELAPPVAKGLANVTAVHSDMLKQQLAHERGPTNDEAVEAAVERLCKSLGELKDALTERDRRSSQH